ncbi:MAG: hypothetical protein N2441_00705 [Rhodocyclaceae bacterium]|nr:hypothetical protein [Rhodocyclaceae bacterium]
MFLLRILGLVLAAVIGAAILAWMFTGQRRYLTFAGQLAKYALLAALFIFALLAAERILIGAL